MIASGYLAILAGLSLGSAVVALPSEAGFTTIEFRGKKYEVAYDPADAIENDPTARRLVPQMIEVDPEEIENMGPIDLDALDFDPSLLENFNETEIATDLPAIRKRNQSSRNYDRGFPYSAIGKVMWDNGVSCSGALIGPRHMLTARHCIPSSGSIRFAPWFNNGENVYPGTNVHIIWTWPYRDDPGCPAKDDWAVTTLTSRIGDNRGWFGVQAPQSRFLGRNVLTSCGYPGGAAKDNARYMYCHHNVIMEHYGGCGDDGAIRANPQLVGGQSGSPLYYTESPNRRIMGVAHGTSAGKSYWASGHNMANTVSRVRSSHP